MRSLILVAFLCLLVIGCEMKTYTLKNGRTRVPVDSTVYKNISKFDKPLLAIIDTGVIYEEYNVESKTPFRLDTDITHRFYSAYKFYSNGCLNHFAINRNEQIDTNTFNPLYNGKRGVYYKQDEQIRYDLFAQYNQSGDVGLLTGYFVFSNDTLYKHTRNDYMNRPTIYIKRKLPSGYLNYSGNWGNVKK